MKNILFFVFIFFLVSCVDVKRPKQIEEIEKCQSELSDTKNQWNTISFDSLGSALNICKTIELRIKQFYTGDTVSVSFANKMESFQSLIPKLIEINSSKMKMDSVFVYRETQLDLLKNDIQKGIGNRANYNENIQFEKEENQSIIEFVNYCDSSSLSALKTFDILRIDMERFSIECEQKFNAQPKL